MILDLRESKASINMTELAMNQKYSNNKFKLMGGVQLTDNFFGVLMAVIIFAAAFLNADTILNFGRWGSEWYEMQDMKTAAATYRALRYDGAAPTSAADLITGIKSTDSVDGASHTNLMSAKSGRWRNGTYNDAWGNPFTFTTDSTGSRCIISAGTDGTVGTDDDITVYY